MTKVKILDTAGNNAAVVCPECDGVFVVSSFLHRFGRACPHCKSRRVIFHFGHNSARTVPL